MSWSAVVLVAIILIHLWVAVIWADATVGYWYGSLATSLILFGWFTTRRVW